jgi:hypothetical protein
LYVRRIIVGALGRFYLSIIELSAYPNRGGWLSSSSPKENIVRNFIIAGAAAAAIVLGTSSAYALPPKLALRDLDS